MEISRQNVGIDIAKDSFVATLAVITINQVIKNLGTKKFDNNINGFKALIKWVKKLSDRTIEVSYTMEATGVYYESLAHYLYSLNVIIHVLLPNTVKKFADSFNNKSKTDSIDSQIIARMGLERHLRKWTLSSKIYRKLRSLTRERYQLVQSRTRCKCQLHAEEHCAESMKSTIKRMKNQIKFFDKQIEAIDKELREFVAEDELLAKKVKSITTTPGLGFNTVVTVIAETGGFDNFKSIKQLTSYSGYDICIKESGSWSGKSHISKKGNKYIRYALYMPSLSTIQYSETHKTFYNRINEKRSSGKIAGTAVQRKLLGLIYTLWKTDSEYKENYQQQKSAS